MVSKMLIMMQVAMEKRNWRFPSEGAKRPKNLGRAKLGEESKRDSSPVGLKMTNRVAKQPQF